MDSCGRQLVEGCWSVPHVGHRAAGRRRSRIAQGASLFASLNHHCQDILVTMSSARPESQWTEPFNTAPNTPLQDTQLLEPPRASYLATQTPETSNSPRGSVAQSQDNSSQLLLQHEKQLNEAFAEDPRSESASQPTKRPIFSRPRFWLAALVVLALVILAVVLPVYFVVIKPHQNTLASPSSSGSGGSGTGSGTGNPGSPTGATTGGNGSLVTTSDGTTFTYINPFGGFCKYLISPPFKLDFRGCWVPSVFLVSIVAVQSLPC
jgi:glucan 1,3-beta-glucosidase